jgi:hypothetical protein
MIRETRSRQLSYAAQAADRPDFATWCCLRLAKVVLEISA